MFTMAVFTIAKLWKQPKCPSIDKQRMCNTIFLSIEIAMSMQVSMYLCLYRCTYLSRCCCCCLLVKLCLTLCNPMDLCPWDFPGKNTGVGCHFLLQGILLIQGSNMCPLPQQADSIIAEPPGKFIYLDIHIYMEYCSAIRKMKHLPFKTTQIDLDSIQFSSVVQSCPTLCDPMNHSRPGPLSHHQLPC